VFEIVKSLFQKKDNYGNIEGTSHAEGHPSQSMSAHVPEHADVDNIPLAAAVLLVEAAIMDDVFEATEEKVIIDLLMRKFECTRLQAVQLLQLASQEAEDNNRFYYYTKTIKDRLTEAGRREIIGMLWDVAYADGIIHDYETNLLRRVCGLLYVNDQESAILRQQAEARFNQRQEYHEE
jgi:uncharacterized tellurite resistance protein B-like protein